MNKDDVIEQLTAQLQDLSVRLTQLEAAASRKDTGSSADTAAAPAGRSASTAAATTGRSAYTAAAPILKKGDRVNITNTVNKPRSWNNNLKWEQEKAQRATVTHFYRGQVHFVTDNGIRTWRAVNNLSRLDQME